jgi:hypothetical protein
VVGLCHTPAPTPDVDHGVEPTGNPDLDLSDRGVSETKLSVPGGMVSG